MAKTRKDITMKFAIDKEPPAKPEIDKELKKVKFKEKLSYAPFLSVIIFLMADFIVGLNCANLTKTTSLVMIPLLVIAYWFWSRIVNFEQQRNDLAEIYKVYCNHTGELCDKYPEVDEYRRKVIESGRKLTQGEYWMLKVWTIDHICTKTIKKHHTINPTTNQGDPKNA
jgi:hypothetical protein